ncbi:MAG TPA: AarF/ABC1/UbiB kinase family protein [Candidatus Dormibacteraeota bacterium]|nr:AarF/ABC1/UbiB kinase family protein [Candidatus Dormibacteraeota bacterium]
MGISLRPRHLKRYRDLAWLLAKYGRPEMVREAGLEEAIDRDRPASQEVTPEGEALARDLESLGPTYIKLGQLLSTRSDLLPEKYLEALTRLQDNVEPFPFADVERIVTEELGVRISKAFASFEATPIAAASLGQVHRALLRDGREVAVKVQRPGIRDRVGEDLEALEQIARWADEHSAVGRQYQLGSLLDEFRRSLLRELDYRQEAQNLVTLGANLAEFDRIVVPQPVSDFTTSRVLTMEFIRGVKVTKLSPVSRTELDGKELAGQLFRAYLKQILIDGFFHADPHPGNVFVTDDSRIALIDLGMVAHVAPRLQEHLIQLLLAVSEGRSDDAVTYSLRIAQRTDEFDQTVYNREVADLVAQHQDATMKEVEVGSVMLQIFNLSGDAGVRMPPELAMLGKALLNLDQVGWLLDPEFNPNLAIRESAADIMQRRMVKSLSPGNFFQNVLELKELAERMPGRLNKILDAVANNEFEIKVQTIDEGKLLSGFQKIANRITLGLLMAALIIGAAMLMQVPTSFRLLGYPGIAILFFLIAALGGLGLMVQILRDDRRG